MFHLTLTQYILTSGFYTHSSNSKNAYNKIGNYAKQFK